jgi:hypothetical protein
MLRAGRFSIAGYFVTCALLLSPGLARAHEMVVFKLPDDAGARRTAMSCSRTIPG